MAKISKAIKTKYNYQIFKTMKNKKYPFLFFLIVLLSTGIGWAQNEKITLHLDNVSACVKQDRRENSVFFSV